MEQTCLKYAAHAKISPDFLGKAGLISNTNEMCREENIDSGSCPKGKAGLDRMVEDWIVGIVSLISLATDLRFRKIFNVVTYPVMLAGLIVEAFRNGWSGFLYSGEGLVLGIGLLLIPFLMNGMGAGDVKLLGAIGALKGAAFTFSAFLYICIAGGVIACILLIAKGQWKPFIGRMALAVGLFSVAKDSFQLLDQKPIDSKFPYALPIVIGVSAAYMIGRIHGV
ncbi:A24 family peptidase [Fodinisporobacter ferrooxydans]|uniref:A24 family peptidase n=1 Tax=Fodinisporobacter ferrooxydans TaxID=2901836 RepID=A0ABY4CLC3_9BACL|nr:A24 family peptidase [Alicyclobacillaceae bacterium MYW30-H2]